MTLSPRALTEPGGRQVLHAWLVAALLASTARPVAAEDARLRPAREARLPVHPVEVRPSGALAGFHAALDRLAGGKSNRVRVLHYGDSNVAADLWTGVVRRTLQERFGDGGAGYLLPPPHGSWHRGEVKIRAGPGWQTRRLGFAKRFGPEDGLWGLAGVAMEASGRGAWVEVSTPGRPEGWQVDFHVLGRPGGRLGLSVDHERARVAEHGLKSGRLAVHSVETGPEAHELRAIVVEPGRVRLLGVAVERRRAGVVYDVLGINGHRVSAIPRWDLELLRAQLATRPPDLVVLSYGGNEGLDPGLTLDEYERQLRDALARIRATAPGASCLLVGPVAMCPEVRRVTAIAETQRRVAPEHGCGFWDSAAVSGGPGSLCDWIRRDRSVVARDHLHLGKRGYELIGRQLVEALLRRP